jgi:rod shape-determining protein MreB
VILDLGKSLGARTVDLISEPMVAAIGANLDVLGSEGRMIVDLGGGTSEAAIVSLGGIVCSDAVRIGGISLNENITNHLKNQFLFSIGELTAEKLKIEVGSLSTITTGRELTIGGTNLKTGLPEKLKVDSKMIQKPFDNYYSEILKMIVSVLEMCPPEIASDLVENGILLVGGCSLTHGIKEKIEADTGVKTVLSESPLLSVATGGSRLLDDNNLFKKIEKIKIN